MNRMGIYQYKRDLLVKTDINVLWDFISSPKNLSTITPSSMNFQIQSNVPDKMYPGLIIKYRVSPLPLYRTDWVTEITHVREKEYFVDEQRHGTYKIWHHEHQLKEVEGGVLMTDIITYQPPFGVLGSLANSVLIKNKIKGIFDFREDVINEIFKK